MGDAVIDPYRRDNRTTEQFQKDILYGSLVERNIIERFVVQYEAETGRKVEVKDNGCGNSGELLHRSQVSGKADYTLNGKPVEVKFNRKKLDKFHLKESQLKSYLKQNASILWVNGYRTDEPTFALMTPDDLQRIKETCPVVPFIPWGGKPCLIIDESEFNWKLLEGRAVEIDD